MSTERQSQCSQYPRNLAARVARQRISARCVVLSDRTPGGRRLFERLRTGARHPAGALRPYLRAGRVGRRGLRVLGVDHAAGLRHSSPTALRSPMVLVLAPGIAALGLGALAVCRAPTPAMLALLFVAGVGVAAYHPQGSGAGGRQHHPPAQPGDGTVHRRRQHRLRHRSRHSSPGPIRLFGDGKACGGSVFRGWLTDAVPACRLPRPCRRQRAGNPWPHHRYPARPRWKPLLTMYLFVVVRGRRAAHLRRLPAALPDRQWYVVSKPRRWRLLSLFLAAGSIGSIVGGVLGDRFGERAVIRLSMFGSLAVLRRGVHGWFPGSSSLQTAVLERGVLRSPVQQPIDGSAGAVVGRT